MDTFQVHILAADKNFYEGPCLSLTVPTNDGELGILAHHSNMIAAIQPGTLRYQVPGEEPCRAAISPGMVKVEHNDVLVLVDSVERPEEIDAARAQRELDEAREILLQQRSRQEHKIAEAAMARALNRLRVKNTGFGQ